MLGHVFDFSIRPGEDVHELLRAKGDIFIILRRLGDISLWVIGRLPHFHFALLHEVSVPHWFRARPRRRGFRLLALRHVEEIVFEPGKMQG